MTNEANAPDMYAIKLTMENYKEFAEWITDGDLYTEPPGHVLKDEIHTKLVELSAQVYERCELDQPRAFGSDDKIKITKDKIKDFNISLPKKICRLPNGQVNIGYLEEYVAQLKNMTNEEGAWALLGMYFLSRCR